MVKDPMLDVDQNCQNFDAGRPVPAESEQRSRLMHGQGGVAGAEPQRAAAGWLGTLRAPGSAPPAMDPRYSKEQGCCLGFWRHLQVCTTAVGPGRSPADAACTCSCRGQPSRNAVFAGSVALGGGRRPPQGTRARPRARTASSHPCTRPRAALVPPRPLPPTHTRSRPPRAPSAPGR